MSQFPALPLFVREYRMDTLHLSTVQHGAYLLLLMQAWGSPQCRLPDCDEKLAAWAGLSLADWGSLRHLLEPFFIIREGWWSQKRLSKEWHFVYERQQSVRSRGKAGGLAKARKDKAIRGSSGLISKTEYPSVFSGENAKGEIGTASSENPPQSARETGVARISLKNNRIRPSTAIERLRPKHSTAIAPTPTPTVLDLDPTTTPNIRTSSRELSILRKSTAQFKAEFEKIFWPAFPHKVGKAAALRAFISARKRGELEPLMSGLAAYVRDKPANQLWCNPATWLNQDRWLDQPARASPNGNDPPQDQQTPEQRAEEWAQHFFEGDPQGLEEYKKRKASG